MTRCSKTGFIVAKSHVFRAPDDTAPRFIVSLCERDKPTFVLVTQLSWLAELKMFAHYKFDGLEHRTYISEYECDFDMVDYYETAGPSPTITELHDTIDPSSLKTDWHLGHDFSMHEGVVTSELSPLGTFTLDNKTHVNAFLVFPFVQLPAIRVGHTIRLYNARCEGENGAVMCGRSFVEVVADTATDDPPTDLPLANVGTASCGLAGYKWLERQFVTLRRKFHVGFLKKNVDCNIGSNAALISDLLLALIRAARDPTCVPSADSRTMLDFLLPSRACLINAATTFPRTDYETLKSSCLALEQLCKPFENEFFVHWSGTVTIDTVGYLNISTETGHWTLSDSTRSVSCVTLVDTPLLPETLCGQFVLVRRCQAVVEKFYAADRRLKCTKLYFVLCEQNIEPLYDCSKDGPDFSPAAEITKYAQNASCALCETSKKLWCPDTVGSGCNEDSATEDITLMDVDTPTQNSDHRHPVVLHYIGTPFVQMSKPGCYALASVLQTDCHSNRDAAFPCVLQFRSLRPLQFLSPGACFYLSGLCPSALPVQVGQGQNFVQSCVVSGDVSPPHVCSPPVSWTDVRDELVRDLHFAEGVVVERRELPINNPGERVGVGLEQYGIPGCKNLMVILDGPAGTHRIYVNTWQTRRYPLGLVPGATVFITMLSRATAMSGNTYYQSTKMTCVTICDIPDMRDFNCVGGRLPPINSPHIIGRGLLRSYQILSVSITAMCALCPGAVYRDARCPNKECQHSSADTNKESQCSSANTSKDCEHSSVNTSKDCEHSIADKTRDSEHVVYDARAKLFARDPEGSCYVLVQDDNVRKLLELPPDVWAEILRWSQTEKIMFAKPFKDEVRKPAATVQIEAVQLYCMTQRIKRRTVAVYCKRNSKDSQLWVCLEFCKLPAG